jgi:hypothetical protein
MNEAGRPSERDRRDPLEPLDRRDPAAQTDQCEGVEPWVFPGELEAFADFELPGEGAIDVEEAFGEHEIEYWVWHDNRLIPAPPDKLARIQELEALQRLDEWRAAQERERRSAQRRAGLAGVRRVWGRVRATVAGALGRDAAPPGARITVPGGEARGAGDGPA